MKSSSLLLQQDSESCISAAPETHPRPPWRGGGLHRQTQGGSAEPQEPQRVEDPCPHPLSVTAGLASTNHHSGCRLPSVLSIEPPL